MTSKIKCPFCQQELREIYFNGVGVGYICPNPDCKKAEKLKGNAEFWQALIQAKQDLAIATKANEEIRGEYEMHHGAERERGFTINWEVVAKKMYNYANKALEQIEHKE